MTAIVDGTATAAANGDLPVPKHCQARAVRHRQGVIMTIETKDVVAFSARLRTYQWGIEQDTLNQAANLIQSQSERIAVLLQLANALPGMLPPAAMVDDEYLEGWCDAMNYAQHGFASLTKAD